MLLYQILNTETGKRLVNSGGYWQPDDWSSFGAFWRTPDSIKKHLNYLLYEWQEREWRYPLQDFVRWDGVTVRAYSLNRMVWEKTDMYNLELSKRLQIVVTEMQTVGASKAYTVDNFMQREAV